MKHLKIIWHMALFFVLLLLTSTAHAKNNYDEAEDQDLNLSSGTENTGGQCGLGCHLDPSTGGTLTINASPSTPYSAGQTGINITANTTGIIETDDTLGIMLLNNSLPLSGSIKNDGWIITHDPNNNIIKYNLNIKSGLPTLNQTFNWTVTTPGTSGTYFIRAQALYGGSGDFNLTSNVLTMIVDGTPPDVISNTNNVNVSNGSLLPLNATITDALSGVNNATVNVSAVNTTINEAVLTNQSGFWLNNTIIADIETGGFVNLTITAYDNVSNVNNTINMTVQVTAAPTTIDVTLSNVPVDFDAVSSGATNHASLFPLNVTIHSTTNVDVNLTSNGTNFISGIYSFDVGNQGTISAGRVFLFLYLYDA